MSDETPRPWYRRIGPGLITACVVIGPGSILTSSKVGAANGYSLVWIIVVAVVFMMAFMTMGARLGLVASESPGTLVAKRAGRWLAILIGCSVFFISAAFQFGNNLGVHAAFNIYAEWKYFIIVFNAVSLAFLFGFRNLYRALERLMAVFVGLMLFSFAVNLAFAGPNVGELLLGLIPGTRSGTLDWSVLGLVGTTFVLTAAYYQAYLVRQKGWGPGELRNGLVDARVSGILMALITLMIMATAGTVLRDQELKDVKDVALQLQPVFGTAGQALFCVGLFSAAYSSFLVNSMIGGFILSDGLGLGSKPTDLFPKLFTAAVLVIGMGVALVVIELEWKTLPLIIAAQAVTVLATPLVAGVLWWLTNREDVMGERRNGPVLNIIGGIGFLLLLAMACYTAMVKLPAGLEKLSGS